MTDTDEVTFGPMLRRWRTQRRLSQLDLSTLSGVSTRHLSFLETGRSRPSRRMVLDLAGHLDVPLRECNQLLTAAGFAPAYPQRAYDAPEMASVRAAVEQVLHGHAPWPALAVDRYWDVVAMNAGAAVLAEHLAPSLLDPPLNVYRASLHPDGLAPRVVNFPEFAHHLLHRLRHDVEVSADPRLADLLAEVEAYPTVRELPRPTAPGPDVVLPMRLRHPEGELALFSVISTFGTPVDVTVAELAIETFFPLDEATATRLRAMVGQLTPA